jgi:hypothetical protein
VHEISDFAGDVTNGWVDTTFSHGPSS